MRVISLLAPVELVSALTRKVNRQEIVAADRQGAMAQFGADAAQYRYALVDMAVVAAAGRLVQSHGLRAYDAIHVAGALALRTQLAAAALPGPVFVGADAAQLAAASREGLLVENANLH